MLNDLKRVVCKATKELARLGLVKFTWGNVSAFDCSMGLFVVSPNGVRYEELQPEQMLVYSMDGQKVEGRLNASPDIDAHRAIYTAWPMSVGSVVNTHSSYATSYAHAGIPIASFGTMLHQVFGGDIPVTRRLTENECNENYYYNVGNLVVETVKDPGSISAVLVNQHCPFSWGQNCMDALEKIILLEELAKITFHAQLLNPNAAPIDSHLRGILSDYPLNEHKAQ